MPECAESPGPARVYAALIRSGGGKRGHQCSKISPEKFGVSLSRASASLSPPPPHSARAPAPAPAHPRWSLRRPAAGGRGPSAGLVSGSAPGLSAASASSSAVPGAPPGSRRAELGFRRFGLRTARSRVSISSMPLLSPRIVAIAWVPVRAARAPRDYCDFGVLNCRMLGRIWGSGQLGLGFEWRICALMKEPGFAFNPFFPVSFSSSRNGTISQINC